SPTWAFRPPRSDRSSALASIAGAASRHETHEAEQYDRSDERDEHRAQPEVADPGVPRGVEQHAADQAADDADHDGAETSEVPAAAGNRPRHGAGDEADDDPTEQAHGANYSARRLARASSSSCSAVGRWSANTA